MITEFVELLCKWQTLLGAAIGGIIGLIAALIVAHSARRREEISAAMVLVANLVKVVTASQILLKNWEGEGIPADNHHRWLSEKLAKFRPSLSPMFEASVARILPVNGKLASHLELFCTIYSDVEIILERIADDYESFTRTGEAPRSMQEMDTDAERAKNGFDTAVQHAICAEHLLSTLILSKIPTFNKIRILLWKTKKERSCNDLLRMGTPNNTLQSESHMDNHSDLEERLKVIDERVQKIEKSGTPQKTEVAKALLSGALPRNRIHLVQQIEYANRLAVYGTLGVWTLLLSRDITDSKVALASGLSAVLIGLCRLYARFVDNQIAWLYPALFQCEEDLAIPKNLSLLRAHALRNIREKYDSAKMVCKEVEAKRIGARLHLHFDWLALVFIIAMAMATFLKGDTSQLSWFEWGAQFHPYVFLFLNLLGAGMVIVAMNCFQTNKGGIKGLLKGLNRGQRLIQ